MIGAGIGTAGLTAVRAAFWWHPVLLLLPAVGAGLGAVFGWRAIVALVELFV
jgi:hypothetical protein